MQFEFIDYDGGYPNLCFGRLKFKADGKIYEEVVSLISDGRETSSVCHPHGGFLFALSVSLTNFT